MPQALNPNPSINKSPYIDSPLSTSEETTAPGAEATAPTSEMLLCEIVGLGLGYIGVMENRMGNY